MEFVKCRRDCGKCKSANIRTDAKGYPFGIECMKHKDCIDMSKKTEEKIFVKGEQYVFS